MSKLVYFILSLLVLIGSVSFHACSDSDDITPPIHPELLPPNSAQQLGRILPSEKFTYTDTVTGLKWDVLTEPTLVSKRIYQTELTFTHDCKWVLFFSNERSTHYAGLNQGYLINHETGQMIQVTEGNGLRGATMRLSRKSKMLYYLYNVDSKIELRSTDVDLLLEDAYKGEIKSSDHYIKSYGTLPDLRSMDCFSLDADESKAYIAFFNYPSSASVENGGIPASNPGTTPIYCQIMSLDLKTKETATVVSTDFQIGHVQANPWVSGEIEFCWETGGKASQRMWLVNTSDGIKRPLYDEQNTEWITHECWADKDNMVFVARRGEPVPPSQQTKPTGMLLVNVRDNSVRVLGQLSDKQSSKGYWHCNTTPDLLYSVGDTNTGEFKGGEVYLVNNTTNKQTSVLARQAQAPDHTHPIFSPDGKYLLVQSGNLSDKKRLCLMMIDLDDIPDK